MSNVWGQISGVVGPVINSLFPTNQTNQQPSAQAFASQQKEQWVNPLDQFKVDPGYWDAYDKAPDSQKSLMQTLAFMGPLSQMSERISDRQEAAANRLLDKQYGFQQTGFQQSLAGALQRDTLKGAIAMLGNGSRVPSPMEYKERVTLLQGPLG